MTTTSTQIAGPAGLPLVGSMLDLKRDSLGTFLAAYRTHGDVVRITAGPPGLRTELYGVFSAEGPSRYSPPNRPTSARTASSTRRCASPSATAC